MREVRELNLGTRFRVAQTPSILSVNEKTMPAGVVFVVRKKYSQSPYYVMVTRDGDRGNDLYSLLPNTLVVGEYEPAPSQLSINKQLAARLRQRKIVAVRVLWDGRRNLSNETGRGQTTAFIRMLYAAGRREYSMNDVNDLMDREFRLFYPRRVLSPLKLVASNAIRNACENSLLEAIYEG